MHSPISPAGLPAPLPAVDVNALLGDLRQIVEQTHRATHAPCILENYRINWQMFVGFCAMIGRAPLPASVETVLLFLAHHGRDRKTNTLRKARAAIRHHHVEAGLPDPSGDGAIKRFFLGHARIVGTAPAQKMPLLVDDVRRLCANLDEEGGPAAIRDKAALLLGFAGALRAGELTASHIENLRITHKGLTLIIPESKTDQKKQGQYVAVVRTANPETDPVVAVEEWLAILEKIGITRGLLFPQVKPCGDPAHCGGCILATEKLSTDAYRAMLKRRCAGIGIDPYLIGGHSLRAGHATQAAENGADLMEIAQQGRWKNLKTVQVYIRSGRRFTFNSSAKLGL